MKIILINQLKQLCQINIHPLNSNFLLMNGLAVNAKVQIPGQTTEVPAQVPVTLPAAQVSDLIVSAQEVKIPAQTGVIPGSIDGSSEVLSVPVSIPEQIVSISQQNAVIPTIEPFRM
jgi:hypothetical protein